MEYHFDVAQDPDNDEYWSIYLMNSTNSGAEIAGKIGHNAIATYLCNVLNSLEQATIRSLFGLEEGK